MLPLFTKTSSSPIEELSMKVFKWLLLVGEMARCRRLEVEGGYPSSQGGVVLKTSLRGPMFGMN